MKKINPSLRWEPSKFHLPRGRGEIELNRKSYERVFHSKVWRAEGKWQEETETGLEQTYLCIIYIHCISLYTYLQKLHRLHQQNRNNSKIVDAIRFHWLLQPKYIYVYKQTQTQRTIGNQSTKNHFIFSVGSKIYAVLSNCSTDVSYWFIRIIPTIIYNILYKYNIIIILYHI